MPACGRETSDWRSWPPDTDSHTETETRHSSDASSRRGSSYGTARRYAPEGARLSLAGAEAGASSPTRRPARRGRIGARRYGMARGARVRDRAAGHVSSRKGTHAACGGVVLQCRLGRLCRGESLTLVARRVGVFAGRDGVGIANLAVAAMDPDFPAALVADDVTGSGDRFLLRISVSARPRASRLLHIPSALGIGHDMSAFISLGHNDHLLCSPIVCDTASEMQRQRAVDAKST